MYVDHRAFGRKSHLVGLFDRLCSELEISEARRRQAEERYTGVAQWLCGGADPLLQGISIYLQGSTALGTTVKPIGRLEHDVDLVAHAPHGSTLIPPARVKAIIGDRLKANGHYVDILEEKPRCWRLSYANEFHLDITPSVPNPACANGGEAVPDKALSRWKESNPKGYRELFERRAALSPMLRVTKADRLALESRADIESFPGPVRTRSLLCRIVQMSKRHRDVHFGDRKAPLAPISVIPTTLIAWSYQRCAAAGPYETEYDFMLDVLRGMPAFISRVLPDGTPGWHIPNESTHGENFAERWNAHPERARAFFAWHGKLVADLEALADLSGSDAVRAGMEAAFGRRAVSAVFSRVNGEVAAARAAGALGVAAGAGLVASTGARASTVVRPNTFYGR